MRVELLNVQTVSPLVHVHVCADGTLDLNGLSSIAFLRIKLSTVALACEWVHKDHAGLVFLTSVVWCRNYSSTSWIKAKVGLVHQLFVK